MNGNNFDLSLLVTQAEINNEARPCKAEKELADRCIEEAQMLDIKPAIGDDTYMRLFDVTDEHAQRLWLGGTYLCGCEQRVFAGLRKALLYYAYARIVRASGGVVTRFDFVVKREDYSDSAEQRQKTQAYQEAFAIADGYKADALRYMRESGNFKGCAKMVNNRIKIRSIGR